MTVIARRTSLAVGTEVAVDRAVAGLVEGSLTRSATG